MTSLSLVLLHHNVMRPVTLRCAAALQCGMMAMPALLDKALSACQDQIHEAADQKAQQEQDFKNSAETKTTIPAMWRPIA